MGVLNVLREKHLLGTGIIHSLVSKRPQTQVKILLLVCSDPSPVLTKA